MHKLDIVHRIVNNTDLSQVKSVEAVNAILHAIKGALQRGDTVVLRRFGTFTVRDKPGRMGRNPQTGHAAPIVPRRVVRFKSGKRLRDAANKAASSSVVR
jgi:DNA-binding protein HU-beta